MRRDIGATGRLERLSPLDVSNLRAEDHGLPMHVAALAILDGSSLVDESGQLHSSAMCAAVEQRLQLAPRLRQVLRRPRFGPGPPSWADHAGFDIRQHVRIRALPAPCGEAELLDACCGLNEQPLNRTRPLWEMWLLTGLPDRKVGLLIRLHHVVADGLAAVAMIAALLDPAAPACAPPPRTPPPMPGGQIRRLRVLAGQTRQMAREGRAPRLSLNRPAGIRRRLLLARADLAQAAAVAHAHGGKVNDVVLAAAAGGARSLLDARGELTPELVIKASVAASTRAPAEQQASGNQVGIMLVPLPVGEADPARRLAQIVRATAERKRLPPYQPGGRVLQRLMVHAMYRQRLVNLLVSNLPGPPGQLHFAGAPVLEVFQVGIVQGNMPVSVGALSYAGQLNFDVVGDPAAVPDLAVFSDGLSDSLAQLGVLLKARPQPGPPGDS